MKETKVIRLKKMHEQQLDSWQARLRRDALGDRYAPIPDENETIDYLLHTYMKEEHQMVVYLLYQKGLTPKQAGSRGTKPGSGYYKQRMRYILQRLVSRSLYAYTRYGLNQTTRCLATLHKKDADLHIIFRLPAVILFASPIHDGHLSKAEVDLKQDTVGDIYLRCRNYTYQARVSGDEWLALQASALYSLLCPCLETMWDNGLFLEDPDLTESFLFRKNDSIEREVLDQLLSLRYMTGTGVLPNDAPRRLLYCCAKAKAELSDLVESIRLAQHSPDKDAIKHDLIHEFAAQLLTGSPIMELLFYNAKTHMTDELIVRRIELENAEYRIGERDRLTAVKLQLPEPLYNALMKESRGSQIRLRSIVWAILLRDIQAHRRRTYLEHPDTEVAKSIRVRLPVSILDETAEVLEMGLNQAVSRALWFWQDNDQYRKQVDDLPI